MKSATVRSVSGGFGRGTGSERQARIARNKKARTGRASWVFRRLSETGLESYLVGRGNLNRTVNLLILISNYRFNICVEYLLEYQGFQRGCRGSDKPLANNVMLERDDVERPLDSLHPFFYLSACVALVAIERWLTSIHGCFPHYE